MRRSSRTSPGKASGQNPHGGSEAASSRPAAERERGGAGPTRPRAAHRVGAVATSTRAAASRRSGCRPARPRPAGPRPASAMPSGQRPLDGVDAVEVARRVLGERRGPPVDPHLRRRAGDRHRLLEVGRAGGRRGRRRRATSAPLVAAPPGRGPHHGGAVAGVGREVGPLGARPRAGGERGALDPGHEEAAPVERPAEVVEREGEDDDRDRGVLDAGQQRRRLGRAGQRARGARPWPRPGSPSTTPSASMLVPSLTSTPPAVAVRLDREDGAPGPDVGGGQPGDHGVGQPAHAGRR